MPNPTTDVAQKAPVAARETQFKSKQPGFGSRHIHDDAPFTLWDSVKAEFREMLPEESEWVFKKYNARRILIEYPDIFIQTDSPPDPIPLILAAAIVRFYPLDVTLHTTIPRGSFFPYSTTQREDLLGYPVHRYEIPTDNQCLEIIEKLKKETSIRSVHFLPPVIIVGLHANDGRHYGRKTLPAKAGGLNIAYHHSEEGFWKGQSQLSYARLTTPSNQVSDNSDYLEQSPFQLSLGVCLSSGLGQGNDMFKETWQSTTAGVMVQRGSERRLTVADHGFKPSQAVFHPSPSGRRIGEITTRWPAWDLAFVEIDPSISFKNARYFAAPSPTRLIVAEDELLVGDWFEVDGISTGRIDMMARGRTYNHHPDDATRQSMMPIKYQEWDVSTIYSMFGPTGGKIQEGICGAPVVDEGGRVGGFFGFLDESGLWAATASLGFLIHQGWSIV